MHLKEALHELHVGIANTNVELLTNMSHKMGEMCEAINQSNQRILAQQEVQTTMMVELVSILRSLGEKLDTLLPGPSTLFKPPRIPTPTTSDPSPSNILFFMIDPITSTKVHITMDEPSIPPPASTSLIFVPFPLAYLPLRILYYSMPTLNLNIHLAALTL